MNLADCIFELIEATEELMAPDSPNPDGMDLHGNLRYRDPDAHAKAAILSLQLYILHLNEGPWTADLRDELNFDRPEEDEDDFSIERGDCPYFLKYTGQPYGAGQYGPGTCGYGCHEEPACITDISSEGWANDPRKMVFTD